MDNALCRPRRGGHTAGPPDARDGKRVIEHLEPRILLATIPWEGPALELNAGGHAQISSNSSLALGTNGADFTLEAVIYVPNNADAPAQAILWKEGAYALWVDRSGNATDQVLFRVYRTGAVFNPLVANVDLSAGWHHLAAVFDNEFNALTDQLRLYADGSRIAVSDATEASQTPDANVSTNPLTVGANPGSLISPFDGWIDEARLSTNARYSGTTSTVPSAPFESDANTRGLWHFNEPPSASTFADSSPRGNTLSAQGGANTGLAPGSTQPSPTDVANVSPDPRSAPVSTINVTWSELLNDSTFNFDDVTLSRDGANVPLGPSVAIDRVSGSTYRLAGLGGFTSAAGAYTLTVHGSGVSDRFGTPGTGSASDNWVMRDTPTVVDVADVAPDPRSTPVQDVDVQFSVPIDLSTFTFADLSLTHDGVNVALSELVTASAAGGSTYRIHGLGFFTNPPGSYTLTVNAAGVTDLSGTAGSGSASDSWTVVPPPTVVGRYAFYNNSVFDTGGGGDDDAVAADKAALLPGGTASFSNLTSYNRGINGVMVDILGLPPGAAPTASDFALSIGDGVTWSAAATTPQISLRAGAGVDGSGRLTLVFADGAIRNTWLRVTVLSSPNTRLAADDVFYFGSLVGDAGIDGSPVVNTIDAARARRSVGATSPTLRSRYDFNRDGVVGLADVSIVRANLGHTLPLFTAPPGAATADVATAGVARPAETSATAAARAPTPLVRRSAYELLADTVGNGTPAAC